MGVGQVWNFLESNILLDFLWWHNKANILISISDFQTGPNFQRHPSMPETTVGSKPNSISDKNGERNKPGRKPVSVSSSPLARQTNVMWFNSRMHHKSGCLFL